MHPWAAGRHSAVHMLTQSLLLTWTRFRHLSQGLRSKQQKSQCSSEEIQSSYLQLELTYTYAKPVL